MALLLVGNVRRTVRGHASAGGFDPADVDFLNREAGAFLDDVTEGGKKLQ
jgi:homoserine O-acetyltransferase/O-succinyltransferase